MSKLFSSATMKARSYVGSPMYIPPELWSPMYSLTAEDYTEKVFEIVRIFLSSNFIEIE